MPEIIIGGRRISCSLLIFDLDNTLIDAEERFRALADARMRVISRRFGGEAASHWARFSGVDPALGYVDMDGPLAKAPRREDIVVAAVALYLTGMGWGEARRLAEEAYEEADRIMASEYRAKPLPGIPETLERLRDAGFTLAVATNEVRHRALRILEEAGLLHLIEVVVGADEVENPKPAPDIILLACRRCGVSPSDAIYVGDQPEDLTAAERAGVWAIGVGSTLRGRAEIYVDSVADLEPFNPLGERLKAAKS